MTQPEAMVLVAALSTFISVIVTLINYLGSRKAQLENERFKLGAATEIEKIKEDIAERKSEKDARRDYEYEARKRLYQECEPLLFQLYEASENALHRIFSLARTAKKGDLDEPQNSWLGGPGYYLRSTVYNLLAPVALFKLIQRRLTLVDMAVEQSIRHQYSLAKAVYISFTDHFDLAEISPEIPYEGNHPQQYELRQSNPARYWRQGIPIGRLDVAAESLLIRDASDGIRLKSFGEFEAEFFEGEELHIPENVRDFIDLFILFHPRSRPVLWRILVVQAHIYMALLAVAQFGAGASTTPMQAIPREDRKRFEWRTGRDQNSDGEVLDEPFSVCEEYLRTHVRVEGPYKA